MIKIDGRFTVTKPESGETEYNGNTTVVFSGESVHLLMLLVRDVCGHHGYDPEDKNEHISSIPSVSRFGSRNKDVFTMIDLLLENVYR